MTTPSANMLRRSLALIAIGHAGLFVMGAGWRDRPGGVGTRAVIRIAERACEDGEPLIGTPSIAEGAQALDRAVLHRTLDMLSTTPRGCDDEGTW